MSRRIRLHASSLKPHGSTDVVASASAVLNALFGFAFSRLLGAALTIVAAVTFAASIELGWHYALDGYVGALVACGIWWFAGRLTREKTL